jgi:hypothetical protein
MKLRTARSCEVVRGRARSCEVIRGHTRSCEVASCGLMGVVASSVAVRAGGSVWVRPCWGPVGGPVGGLSGRGAQPRTASGLGPRHFGCSCACAGVSCVCCARQTDVCVSRLLCPRALLCQSLAVPEPCCARALLCQSLAVPEHGIGRHVYVHVYVYVCTCVCSVMGGLVMGCGDRAMCAGPCGHAHGTVI